MSSWVRPALSEARQQAESTQAAFDFILTTLFQVLPSLYRQGTGTVDKVAAVVVVYRHSEHGRCAGNAAVLSITLRERLTVSSRLMVDDDLLLFVFIEKKKKSAEYAILCPFERILY